MHSFGSDDPFLAKADVGCLRSPISSDDHMVEPS